MRSFFLLLVSAFLLFTNASAKRVWVSCFFAGNSGLEYKDTNVSSSIHIDGSDGELYFYNKSGKTIYIDLANSHVFLNGQTQCLASLSTTVKINDSYKKLNSIERMRANIIAINSDSWQNTLFVFSIDDNLRKDVITKGKYSCGFAQLDFGRKGKFIDPQTKKGVKFQVGMTRHYDENTTPLDMRAIISYSTDPNFSQKTIVRVQNYITDIVIDRYHCDNFPNCASYKGKQCYRFRTGGANPLGTIAGNITIAAMFAGSIALLAAPFL